MRESAMISDRVTYLFRIDGQKLLLTIPELLDSDYNYNSEDFYVFDINGFTKVEELFKDDSYVDWITITLDNDREISVTDDQMLLVNDKPVSACDIKEGDIIYYYTQRVPCKTAYSEKCKVRFLSKDYKKVGYELMTSSKTYVCGGFPIISI